MPKHRDVQCMNMNMSFEGECEMVTEKRKMDGTGRVTVPARYRRYLNLKSEDNIEFVPCREGILIRKAVQGCIDHDNGRKSRRSEIREDELVDFIMRNICKGEKTL